MAVRKKEMRLLRASKLFEAPQSTLKNKVKSKEQNTEELVNNRIRRKLVLSGNLENESFFTALVWKNSHLALLSRMVEFELFKMGVKLCTFLLHLQIPGMEATMAPLDLDSKKK
jgi:hypothetical protein